MGLHNQPKYGGSASRSASSHRSFMWRKLCSLSDDHTANANGSGYPWIGISMWPRTKKVFSSTTHRSLVSSTRWSNSLSGTSARHGASIPKQSGRSSCSRSQVGHFQVMVLEAALDLALKAFPVVVVTGSRQTGKSTLVLEETGRVYKTLDDLSVLERWRE